MLNPFKASYPSIVDLMSRCSSNLSKGTIDVIIFRCLKHACVKLGIRFVYLHMISTQTMKYTI